jgi:signal transduction histidine kinase
VLTRRLVIAFLVVTVPGTIILGAVMLYSLRSLATVSDQLAEITLSLEATRELQQVITETAGPITEFVATRHIRHRVELERLLNVAEEQARSCASSSCHSQSRTPADMASTLAPAIARLREDARAVLDSPPGHEAAALSRLARVNDSIAAIRSELQPMSTGLLKRVNSLADEARIVSARTYMVAATLTIAVAVIACVVALVIAAHLTRPLRDLLAGIRRVMSGDWSGRVAVAGPLEFREVGAAFNRMVQELVQVRQRIEDDNRTLEERVRERTEELKRKDEALAQSERLASIGLLAAGVAHELNNPLTSVMLTTHLLLEDVGTDTPMADELRRIDGDVARCKRIIDDLRAFARRSELEKVPSTVVEVVDQALWYARADFASRGIELVKELAPDLPPMVWDPGRIVQVLTNLLVNAAQAMESGGHIAVRARRVDGSLCIEVEDDGPGIRLSERSQIFDPFFTTKRRGNGLGLSISHGIVAKHGGRIEVETRTNDEVPAGTPTGTTVRVLLPG